MIRGSGIPAASCGLKRIVVVISAIVLGGCTVHPPGENAERIAAALAGRPFEARPEARNPPPLPDHPSPGQLVDYALRTNAGLEQKYWEWRSAIEQIPQDGTQPTNLALSANLSVQRGRTDWGQATLAAGNDPMADIVLPPKLTAAAQRALQNARAAGLRFHKARLDLRAKVLIAWYDYALVAELIRLEEANGQLLKTIEMITETRSDVGFAGQLDVLKARDEAELSINDVAAMRAQLPAQRSALNALLNRAADAALPAPASLPPRSSISYSDAEALARAVEVSPELAAQLRDIDGRRDGVTLARLQSLPDVSIGASTDLKGLAQSALAMVTVPTLRHEAIDAAIAQAEANVRAAEAARHQARNDLATQVIADLATLRDADRQLDLIGSSILPRAERAAALARSAYESGRATLLDLLDAERSVISIRRLVANLGALREKRAADLDTALGD